MVLNRIIAFWNGKKEGCILQDENNVYDSIFNDKTQTGLAKVENVFVLNLQDTSKQKVDKFALPYIKNPKFLARSLKMTYETSTQFLQSLIEQGIEDVSIKTKYPSELASSLSLLTNFGRYYLWIIKNYLIAILR